MQQCKGVTFFGAFCVAYSGVFYVNDLPDFFREIQNSVCCTLMHLLPFGHSMPSWKATSLQLYCSLSEPSSEPSQHESPTGISCLQSAWHTFHIYGCVICGQLHPSVIHMWMISDVGVLLIWRLPHNTALSRSVSGSTFFHELRLLHL